MTQYRWWPYQRTPSLLSVQQSREDSDGARSWFLYQSNESARGTSTDKATRGPCGDTLGLADGAAPLGSRSVDLSRRPLARKVSGSAYISVCLREQYIDKAGTRATSIRLDSQHVDTDYVLAVKLERVQRQFDLIRNGRIIQLRGLIG